MLGCVVQTTSDEEVCPARLRVVMKHHRGELMMILVYTSTHTAQGSGLTVTVNPSQNTTCMIHRTPYTWCVTNNSAKCPEQAADGWQVPSTRDNSNLVFLLVERAIRVESSVGLAHSGRASHPHFHYEWLQYGLI